MKLFKVAVMEVHRKDVFIESTSRRNAAMVAQRMYNSGEIDKLDDKAVSVSFRADIEDWDIGEKMPKSKGA